MSRNSRIQLHPSDPCIRLCTGIVESQGEQRLVNAATLSGRKELRDASFHLSHNLQDSRCNAIKQKAPGVRSTACRYRDGSKDIVESLRLTPWETTPCLLPLFVPRCSTRRCPLSSRGTFARSQRARSISKGREQSRGGGMWKGKLLTSRRCPEQIRRGKRKTFPSLVSLFRYYSKRPYGNETCCKILYYTVYNVESGGERPSHRQLAVEIHNARERDFEGGNISVLLRVEKLFPPSANEEYDLVRNIHTRVRTRFLLGRVFFFFFFCLSSFFLSDAENFQGERVRVDREAMAFRRCFLHLYRHVQIKVSIMNRLSRVYEMEVQRWKDTPRYAV